MFNPLLSLPSEAVLYPTSKCNGRCKFCLRQLAGYASAPDITVAIVDKVLNAFPRISSVCVAGFGEPLMMEELPKLLLHLEQRRVYAGVITNGLLLRDRFTDIAWKSSGHVTISLNAATKREHESAFGVKDGFDVVADGIDLLNAASIPIVVAFVVGKNNWQRIPDYLRIAREMGSSSAVMVNTLPHGDVTDPVYRRHFLTEEVITVSDTEIVAALQGWRSLAHELGVHVLAWPVPIDPSNNPKLCLSPFARIGVDGNGDITGCIRIIPPKTGQGNISAAPLVWATSPHLTELRDGLTGVGKMRPECEFCFGNWIKG